jgi:DNA modification methylase
MAGRRRAPPINAETWRPRRKRLTLITLIDTNFMSIYFQSSFLTVHHGDCMKVMPTLDRVSVALVASDLPYGMTACKWDSGLNLEQLWANYNRVLKPDGAVVLTASQPFTSELVVSNKPWFRYEWIWRKNRSSNFLNAKKQPLKAHESVLVFAPGAPRYFAQKTAGHVPINRAYRRASSSTLYRDHMASVNNGGDTTRWPTTILEVKCLDNISKERVHPTQKPVALFEYLIRTYTREGETVLDNCAGSGTAAIACRNAGRHCVLIEREEKYCEQIVKRLTQGGLALV